MWALKFRSRQYLRCNKGQYFQRKGNVFLFINSFVLIQKNGVLLNFNSEDNETIENLRKYIAHLFRGTVIGVSMSNPVTASLEEVHEFLIGSLTII